MQNECSDIPRRGDSLCTNIKGCPEGRSLFDSGSSNRGEQHPCWHRVSKGKQRCPWQGYPKGTAFPLVHDFPAGKSSVLYLCFRLTPGRGWLRHLQSGQMDSRQTLPGGSRAGEFCTPMDEIRICTAGKIRLTEKGSKGISTPVPPQRQHPR